MIGTRVRASAAEAAFANAVLGHGLVREDMHTGSVSHLGIVIFPTLLALRKQVPKATNAQSGRARFYRRSDMRL